MSLKAGFVGLIGMPNAGKSSLVNLLMGSKLSIVSSKPQTTRKRVLGVINHDQTQMIFVDAPGVVQAKAGLNSFLEQEYKGVVADSDVLVAVLNIDAKSEKLIDDTIEIVKSAGKPWMAVITKVDLQKDHRVQAIRQKLSEFNVPVITTSIKSEREAVMEKVFEYLIPLIPEVSAWFYEEDVLTTSTMREMAAEMIREKCFARLHEEIPYGLAVKVRSYEEDKKITKIYAEIIVEKEGQKAIVVGHQGSMIKWIGTEARKDIQDLIESKIFLELHVVVKPQWSNNLSTMKELGYVTER